MSLVRRWWPPLLVALLLAGCGQGGGMGADVSGAQNQQDYGQTKQMVVDILHSPDGKKAVADILQDPTMKQQIVVSETDITKAVEHALQNNKNQSFLTQAAKDPKFAAALAKAVQPNLIQLQKQLIKDPQYQGDMMVLLKSPEFTQHLQELLQTPQFRSHVMKIMTDALQTPSFRMQFQDALKQAVSESMPQAGGGGGDGGQSKKGRGQGGGDQGQSDGGGGGS
ncbi:spore germination lipoprotein GerD [Alicyclobacillus pomorum]|jgi:spore germination protein D|uniref:spore germination lipoprotein GerD n=1 Tax=Alicyclobacillus pomorum TaxID=204470 RepID=UPI0004105CB4|nr:spore germination lipoprotein GerD [Alicyclobacillus pomorum]